MPEKDGERLGSRDGVAVGELRFGVVDMLVIQSPYDLLVQNAVEQFQVQHHGRVFGKGSGDRYGAFVIVAVTGCICARPEDFAISLLAPLRTKIAVRRAEPD